MRSSTKGGGLFRERIWSRPDQDIALTFLQPGGPVDVTVEELRLEVLEYSIFLKESGLVAADRVILAFSQAREQVVAFLACLYIGVVPCLVAAFERSIAGAARALGGCTLLTTPEMASRFSTAVRVLCRPATAFTGCVEEFERSPDQDLYIQFSSGTSAAPKGARISAGALQAQIGALQEFCGFGDDEVSVSWLPLHHDLGLVLHLFTPLALGFRSVLLSPKQWLRRPKLLFQALTDYRGTICCMPASGFEYALRRLQPDSSVDLESWRIAGCAAEPISFRALQRFAETFQTLNFCPSSLRPAYGMAENVAGVSAKSGLSACLIDRAKSGQGDLVEDGDYPVVSCGSPLPGVEVRVVGEGGEVLSTGVVGEFQVRGDSLFSGYLGVEATEAWHSTGDLGFLKDGELYPLGRCREVFNIGGCNIYPSELEEVAGQVLGSRTSRVVAFSALEEKRPVVACEWRGRPERDAGPRLQQAFLNSGLPSSEILFVPRGWIEVTTSGKLARARCRQKYLREQAVDPDSDLSPIERGLAETVADCLGLDSLLRPTDNLLELGLSSLEISGLLTALEKKHDLLVSLPQLVACPTLRELAQLGPEKHESHRYAVCLRSGERPVFLIPGMRQSALLLKRLLPAVSPERACYALQTPGFNGREQPFTSVVENAQAFLQEIRELQRSGPYSLVGVCYGGWVAYEMARQIQEQGADVERLILLDVDPHHPPNRSKPTIAGRIYGGLRNRLKRVRRRVELSTKPHLAAHERVYRAQMKAAYGYTPRPYSGEVNLLVGCPEQVHNSSKFVVFEWAQLVGERLRAEIVQNDGGCLLEDENLPSLNEALRKILA